MMSFLQPEVKLCVKARNFNLTTAPVTSQQSEVVLQEGKELKELRGK